MKTRVQFSDDMTVQGSYTVWWIYKLQLNFGWMACVVNCRLKLISMTQCNATNLMIVINQFHDIFHCFGHQIDVPFLSTNRSHQKLISRKTFINSIEFPLKVIKWLMLISVALCQPDSLLLFVWWETLSTWLLQSAHSGVPYCTILLCIQIVLTLFQASVHHPP